MTSFEDPRDALYALEDLFDRAGDEEARAFADGLAEAHDADPELILPMAVGYADRDPELAVRWATRAAADTEDAALAANAAGLLTDLGAAAEARTAIAKARRLADETFVFRAELRTSEGKLAAAEGDAKEARAAFAEAWKMDPGGVGIGREYARFLMRQGELRKARRVVKRAMRNEPDDPASQDPGLLALRDELFS